jgi:hypothetical protein
MGSAWGAHVAAYHFVHRLKSERRATTAPYALVGSRLLLAEQVMALDGGGAPMWPAQTLLVVYSDRCGVCKENRESWNRLLRQLPNTPGGELWIVTLNSADGLAGTLQIAAHSGLRTRLFRAAYSDALGFATGFNGTPVTAVVDRNGDLRASVLGPSRTATAEIVAAWNALTREEAGTP